MLRDRNVELFFCISFLENYASQIPVDILNANVRRFVRIGQRNGTEGGGGWITLQV